MTEENFVARLYFRLNSDDVNASEKQLHWAKIRKSEKINHKSKGFGIIFADKRRPMRLKFVDFCLKRGIDLAAPDWFENALLVAAADHKELQPSYRKRGRPRKQKSGQSEFEDPPSEGLLEICDAAEVLRAWIINNEKHSNPPAKLIALLLVIRDRLNKNLRAPMTKKTRTREFDLPEDRALQKWYQDQLTKCKKMTTQNDQ
jgi:hypothetical protein